MRQMMLTLILLTLTKWWAPSSARKWQMGFISAFKGLKGKSTVGPVVALRGIGGWQV
jgi:hypothetical protein